MKESDNPPSTKTGNPKSLRYLSEGYTHNRAFTLLIITWKNNVVYFL